MTTTFVGAPSIAEDMSNPYLIPSIQTLVDVVFLLLLFVPKSRNLFCRLQDPSTD